MMDNNELGASSLREDRRSHPSDQAPAGLGGARFDRLAGRSALEQSFADLAEKHDLLTVNVTLSQPDNSGMPPYFGVSLQWRDRSQEYNRGCAQQHGRTIGEALGNAVADMLAQRNMVEPIALADEALPEIVA